MNFIQKNDVEALAARYLPDFPIAIFTEHDSQADCVAELLKKYPDLDMENAQALAASAVRTKSSDRYNDKGAATGALDIGDLLIGEYYLNTKSINDPSTLIPTGCHIPENLAAGAPMWGAAHDLGHLIWAWKTGIFKDYVDEDTEEARVKKTAKEMRESLKANFNLDIREEDCGVFEESLCDLFGSAVASRITGVPLKPFMRELSDMRIMSLSEDIASLYGEGKVEGIPFLYYVSPMLDQALVHFEVDDRIADKNLFMHCLRFAVETYRRAPTLFEAPQKLDESLSDVMNASMAAAAGMKLEDLVSLPPLGRCLVRVMRATENVYPIGMKPGRGPGRDDGSTPSEHGLT